MPRDCASCSAPFGVELDRQMRSGVPLSVLAPWTAANGLSISAKALGRHRRDHIGRVTAPGRKGLSDDLATAIRDRVHERLAEGDIQPGVRDGLSAQALLDRREQAKGDRDWMLRLALVLSGQVAPGVVIELEPASAAIEAEYRVLLEAGTEGR